MILRRMAQILRVRKPEYLTLVRAYGTRRVKRNYYETLRISPAATQKEIRSAYVKLSKEWHPDISKKDSHKEFVEINEAYKVLSKEKTKREYDASLHYRPANPYRMHGTNQSRRSYESYTSYDQTRDFYNEWYQPGGFTSNRRQRGYTTRPPTESETEAMKETSFNIALICMLCMTFATIVQLLLVKYSFTMRKDKMLEQNRKLEQELEVINRAGQQRETYDQREAFILDLISQQQQHRERQAASRKSE